VLLQRKSWHDNHKRTRLQCIVSRGPLLTGPHQRWSMDFVSDQLFNGRRFRALTLVDNYSCECLEIEVGQNLKRYQRRRVMERIKPCAVWCRKDDNQVTLDFSRPGKPTENPFIESFNGSFRDECLNVNWFLSLEDAKEKLRLFKE